MKSHKSPFIRVTAVSRFGAAIFVGLFIFTLVLMSQSVQASSCTVNVTTKADLTNALSNASQGQVICLADGTYNGNFVITNSGSVASPITLRGSSNAILEGIGITATGYGLHVNTVQYWILEGFTVQNSQKGIILDSSHHILLDGLTVKDVGDEAVHFRTHSTYNRIQNSTISNTGLREPGFGEGVYIGSANSNWCTYTACQPDLSHYNEVLNNHFGPNVRAEAVDAKEGTLYGLIEGNTFDGSGVSGINFSDSWIDIKADHYLIRNNSGTNANANSTLTRGFHVVAGQGGSYGNYNHFEGNTLNFNGTCTKDAFFLSGGGVGNTVCGEPNNTVINAGCDFASNDFEILSCSDVPTATSIPGTPTVTPPATNTPDPSSVALKVQYQVGDSSATDNAMKPNLRIVNEGTTAVSLNQLTMRYWFTEAASGFNYNCDYATLGCGNVTGQIVATGGNDYYLEVGFTGGTLAAGDDTGNLKNRVNRTDWAAFAETNDYSYDAGKSSYTDWNRVTLYLNGALIWGIEPNGSVLPTNTPVNTTTPPTATPTATSQPPTATSLPPTATPTATTQPPTATNVAPTAVPPTATTPATGSSDIEVQAKITKDEASKTQYDVKLINNGTAALSGYSFRVYIDISEILSAGHSASDLRCDENYDATGAGSCSFSQYSGNIYYANVNFGSYSLAANDDARYKFTIRLNGWASDIDSSNDFSRQGLTGSYQVTNKIPVYQGSTLITGVNP